MAFQEAPPNTTNRAIFCYNKFQFDGCKDEQKCPYAHSAKQLVKLEESQQKLYRCVLDQVQCCPAEKTNCNFAHGAHDIRIVKRIKNAKERQKERFRERMNNGTLITQHPIGGGSTKPISRAPNLSTPEVPEVMVKTLIEYMMYNDGVGLSEFPVSFKQRSGLSWDYLRWGFGTLTESLASVRNTVYIEEVDNLVRIFINKAVHSETEKRWKELPQCPPIQELDYSDAEFEPLEDDRSHYSDWETGEPEMAILSEQLKLKIPNIICGICERVVTRESLLLQCGHLYCRCCLAVEVDRKRKIVTCKDCKREFQYERSCYEKILHVHTKSRVREVRQLARLIESVPCRCKMQTCMWNNNVGHWRRHYPVCTIISRMDKLRTRQVLTRRYEKREENLDPEELSMMTVAEHKKYFNVQASETEDTSRILEEIRKAIKSALCVSAAQMDQYRKSSRRFRSPVDYPHQDSRRPIRHSESHHRKPSRREPSHHRHHPRYSESSEYSRSEDSEDTSSGESSTGRRSSSNSNRYRNPPPRSSHRSHDRSPYQSQHRLPCRSSHRTSDLERCPRTIRDKTGKHSRRMQNDSSDSDASKHDRRRRR